AGQVVRQWAGRLLGLRGPLALVAFAAGGAPGALYTVLGAAVLSVLTAATVLMRGGDLPPAAGPAVARDGLRPRIRAGAVLALRDDGAAARWAGRLVQGNLIPLPPALAGLIATAMLAALGLRDLPGFIAMTPPVVMMLAAPGSSHPHDGN